MAIGRVLLHTADNPGYAFACLPTIFSWRRWGWGVHVGLRVGNEAVELRMRQEYERAGACVYRVSPDAPAPMHPLSWTMLSRYYAAQEDAALYGGIVILGDADLLRTEPLDWPVPDGDPLVTVGRNLWNGTEWEPRWPTCHIGGTAAAWAQLRYTVADIEAVRRADGWLDDEVLFRHYQLTHPEIRRP